MVAGLSVPEGPRWAHVNIEVGVASLSDILDLRDAYRGEMDAQIVHDSLHERGFTVVYGIRIDGIRVGYGTVVGFGDEPKDTVNEFFVLPERRGHAQLLFKSFMSASGARRIRAQTNDTLLLVMLYDHARAVERTKILFSDGASTSLPKAGDSFRRLSDAELARAAPVEGVQPGEWGIEVDGRVVASGGVLYHYNEPYGDIYMSVLKGYRRRGLGCYLVQELKRVCYAAGKVPAARCDASNVASRATLQRAGMFPCGAILEGVVAEPER